MESAKFESNSPSLQELVREPLLSVPQRFISNDQLEPPSSFPQFSPLPAIPIIDMTSLTFEEAKEFLHSTCKEWGMFQLINHGVSSLLVEKLKHEIEEFYKLPIEEKMRYKLRPGEVEGYGQTILHTSDQKIDWADRFFMKINPIHIRKPHLFPELPSSLRETLEDYIKETEKLATTLLKLSGQGLKMNEQEIEEMFEDGFQTMRMNYYPPCPQPELVMGLTPHSDATGITILLQVNGVDGLQVKKDGVWIPVKILPDALVVNIGDTMEILSNGIYKSIEHRATVNSVHERISIAMFFNPKLEAEIGPAACLINNQTPPLYRRVTMEKYVKDFFSHKLNGKSFLESMKIAKET